MTDKYFLAIANYLSMNDYSNRDVRITMDGMVCGVWLWDEVSRTHVHFHRLELVQMLGISKELVEWLEHGICQVTTSWKFINPSRFNAISA